MAVLGLLTAMTPFAHRSRVSAASKNAHFDEILSKTIVLDGQQKASSVKQGGLTENSPFSLNISLCPFYTSVAAFKSAFNLVIESASA